MALWSVQYDSLGISEMLSVRATTFTPDQKSQIALNTVQYLYNIIHATS